MWQRTLLISGLVGLIGAIESAGIMSVSWLAYSFSLAFITVFIFALMFPIQQALWWGLLQGLVVDLYSPSLFGTYLLSGWMLIVVVKWLRQTWFKQTSVLAISVVAVMSLSLSYVVFAACHYLGYALGLLIINPLTILTWQGWIFGLLAECVVIIVLARVFTIFQRFVLV